MTRSSDGVRHLVDRLSDADPDVRLQSALELGEERHVEAAPALVDRFGRECDFQVREILTWATLRMPDASIPLVRAALDSPRWLARLQAVHTVSKLGERADGVRLLPLVSDPIDVVASRAYWAVAQCGDPVVVPALVAELSRGSAEHRNSLLVALSHFGAAAVPSLAGAVRHGAAPSVRAHAADTLAYLGSPDAEPALGALLDATTDEDGEVRVAALNALGHLHVRRAWDRVDELLGSEDRTLRLLATRLAERRPSDRALHLAALRADAVSAGDETPDVVPGFGGPWPSPDLSLVAVGGSPLADELAPALALQVEVCRPRWLSRDDVPQHLLDGVWVAAHDDALERGRPGEVAARIAVGAVEQYVHEHVFLEQVSVHDPGRIVKDLLFGTEVSILDFVRLPPATGR